MTNNEKAATFIGWAPDQPCDHIRLNLDRWTSDGKVVAMGRGWTCDCGFYHVPAAPFLHNTPAPDMGKPENYMQAKVNWLIDTYQCQWIALSSDHEATGSNAVEALARLYDFITTK